VTGGVTLISSSSELRDVNEETVDMPSLSLKVKDQPMMDGKLHTNALLANVPRQLTPKVEDDNPFGYPVSSTIDEDLISLDPFHCWSRRPRINNLNISVVLLTCPDDFNRWIVQSGNSSFRLRKQRLGYHFLIEVAVLTMT
jgi:hypothetical protein